MRVRARNLRTGRLELENRQDFRDLSWLRARFEVLVDGVPVQRGKLRLPRIAPGEKQTVELPLLGLSDLNVVLERREGKANYKVILENLKRLESGEKKTEDPAADSGKRFVVRKVDIRDVAVTVDSGVWKDLLTGRRNPALTLASSDVQVEGGTLDLVAFLRLFSAD